MYNAICNTYPRYLWIVKIVPQFLVIGVICCGCLVFLYWKFVIYLSVRKLLKLDFLHPCVPMASISLAISWRFFADISITTELNWRCCVLICWVFHVCLSPFGWVTDEEVKPVLLEKLDAYTDKLLLFASFCNLRQFRNLNLPWTEKRYPCEARKLILRPVLRLMLAEYHAGSNCRG